MLIERILSLVLLANVALVVAISATQNSGVGTFPIGEQLLVKLQMPTFMSRGALIHLCVFGTAAQDLARITHRHPVFGLCKHLFIEAFLRELPPASRHSANKCLRFPEARPTHRRIISKHFPATADLPTS